METWDGNCILHVDLDAFFASVEQLDNPEYRGKPVIVGGKPNDRRSVVSTASYEARKFGVHSAMPIFQAYKLCPQGIFVYGRFSRYHEKSQEVMNILDEYSPDIEQVSVDEAYVDLTGTQRLFGAPEETAWRLKREIKEKTHLTISVGLAPNRYIAKIASGLKKPDGFCEVLPGQEEQFMLSLPMEKLWGAGSKTQEKLRAAGFRTIADIRKRSLPLLRTLFGDAGGTFLYNAVRGRELESESAKTHSLSAERTFDYDLVDSYTAETVIMELAHTVMFRLLRENLTSRTVVLKLRYEDFSTVNIQETAETEITSTDDLFTRACRLFEKKYDATRGIRLLGLGVQNTADSAYSKQQELFDFGKEKKQKIEKAILDLEKKHPDVKIQKARLLDKNPLRIITIFLAALLLAIGSQGKITAEDETSVTSSGAGAITFDTDIPPIPSESPSSLFNYTINDQNVEFLAQGYWQSKIKQTTSASFGFGKPFALSIGTPVLIQEVDLSLWFMLNKQWYFETSFADGFDKNTVAAGYHGDGYLQEARIANRGIVFPSIYSIDKVGRGIGGGDNQAPGISVHFADGSKWKADALLRYDMTETKEKLYYGKNSVSDETIQLSSWLTGHEYVLPEKSLVQDIDAVYVENSTGGYTDSQGRTYKKLSSSEYLLLPARCEIVLSENADASVSDGVVPAVAVTFASSGDISTLKSDLGTYGTAESAGSGFLGAVQKFFGKKTSDVPSVALYSYGGDHHTPDSSGTQTDGFFTTLESTTALLIQYPAGFSPFTAAYRYDCGTVTADDVLVVSDSSGTSSDIYAAVVSDDDTAFVSDDFFSDTHTYVDAYQTDTQSSSSSALVTPSVRYPFADSFPGYYLGGSTSGDLVLKVRSYTAVSRFDIGTDAVQGTVRVYKNGVLDSGASYDSEDGTVTLSSAISSSDRIKITWEEDNSSTEKGAITAAAGFLWALTPQLSADISLATRWTYAPNMTYAESNSTAPGFATIAAGASYETEKLKASNTMSLSLDDDNTTGYYRILGMDDTVPDTIYLTETAGVSLPSGFEPKLNSRPESGDDSTQLDEKYDGSVSAADGKTDSYISGYRIPVSWNFSSWENKTVDAWAATAIDLGSSGSVLSSGTQFSIALKATDTSVTDYDVYLQLGVSATDDFTVEDTGTIPTWKISDSTADDVLSSFSVSDYPTATDGWQTVTVRLTDTDRARFACNYDARIVIVAHTVSGDNKKGTLYVGPYEIVAQSVFVSSSDDISTESEQRTDGNLSNSTVSKLNTGTNKVEKISWENTGDASTQADEDFDITLSRYFAEVDLSSYKDVNMYFCYTASSSETTAGSTETEGLTFILDRDAEGISSTGKIAVKAVIPAEKLASVIASSEKWHKLTIDLSNKTISIDDTDVGTAQVDISVVPVRLKMIVNTAPDNTAYTKGTFCFDEVHLSGAEPYLTAEDKISVSYAHKGALLSAGSVPLIQDVSLTANGTISTGTSQSAGINPTGDTAISATIASLAFSVDAAHASDSTHIISGAGHSIATTIPFFGLLSATESYRFDSTDESTEKKNTVTINFNKLHIPLTLSAQTEASGDPWSIKQNAVVSSAFSAGSTNGGYMFRAEGKALQKLLPSTVGVEIPDYNNYGAGWQDCTALAFSPGSSFASRRKISGGIYNTIALPFASLRPEINFTTDETYKSSSSAFYTDTAVMSTKIPFKIGRHTIALSWEKGGGGVSTTDSGGNYKTDANELIRSLKSREWFFTASPFYDLGSKKLSEAVLADTTMTEDSDDSLYYTTNYAVTWQRPVFASIQDLWIPSGASLQLERDIRTAEAVSDIYQIKNILNYTAFNIFGTTGSHHIFNWYKQDEIIGSVSITAKIPHTTPEDYTFLYSGYIQSNFYMDNADVLKTGGELTYETTNDWSGKLTAVWKRGSKESPLIGLVKLFVPSVTVKNIKLTRTDSVNISATYATSSTTTNSTVKKEQIFDYTHLVEAQVTKYVSVDASVGGSYDCMWESSILVSFTASLSGKVQF